MATVTEQVELPIYQSDRKRDALSRLSKLEGQLRGVRTMIEQDRPCVEVLTQIAAVIQAMRGMSKVVMRNYLERCATEAIRSQRGDEIYDELMDVIYKLAK